MSLMKGLMHLRAGRGKTEALREMYVIIHWA